MRHIVGRGAGTEIVIEGGASTEAEQAAAQALGYVYSANQGKSYFEVMADLRPRLPAGFTLVAGETCGQFHSAEDATLGTTRYPDPILAGWVSPGSGFRWPIFLVQA